MILAFEIEEERNKILLEALVRVKDWEDDKIQAIY